MQLTRSESGVVGPCKGQLVPAAVLLHLLQPNQNACACVDGSPIRRQNLYVCDLRWYRVPERFSQRQVNTGIGTLGSLSVEEGPSTTIFICFINVTMKGNECLVQSLSLVPEGGPLKHGND